MKLIAKLLTTGAVAAAALTAATPSVQAQNNPSYTPGDLVLFFQNPNGSTGSDQQVFASLGNTATTFRQAFVDQANLVNIININTQLTTAFGSSWANTTTVYGGAGGVWGNSGNLSNALQNGDPNRTLYTTERRVSIGTVGSQNSVGFNVGADGTMTSIANSMIAQNLILENNAVTAAAVVTAALPPSQSIALQNPVGGNGWNGNIAGDKVQQAGQVGNFGAFGSINNVEYMWDLFRIQAKSSISGQYGQGDATRTGQYLGTLVLDNSGNVSFVTTAVPEPGTWAAAAIAATLLGAGSYRRFRRRGAEVIA